MTIKATPLQIKTDSTVGSGDLVSVEFITMDVFSAGGFTLHFTNPMQYEFERCTDQRWLLSNVPAQQDKVWTFYRVSQEVMRIECNDVEVAQYTISNCRHSEKWIYQREMERFKFYPADTATDFYRAKGKDHYTATRL